MRLKIAALGAALATVLGLAACNEVSDTYPRDGWPTFETTGPSALGLDELNLPACSTLYASAPANSTGGTWYLTTANQVLQNCAFRGKQIVVQASGVTLRGMVIAGDANLHVLNDSTGLTIDATVIGPDPDGTYSGTKGEPCSASVAYSDYTITRSELANCADAVKARGTVVIEDSLLHSFSRSCNYDLPADPCTHNDMLQLPDVPGYPLDLTFSGNAVYAFACVSNTHFQVKNMQGGSLEITDNFFYGLGSIIKAGGTAHDIAITFSGNTLAGAIDAGPFNIGPTGKVGLWSGSGISSFTRTDNVFESGDVLPDAATALDPYTCAAMPPPEATTTTTTAP